MLRFSSYFFVFLVAFSLGYLFEVKQSLKRESQIKSEVEERHQKPSYQTSPASIYQQIRALISTNQWQDAQKLIETVENHAPYDTMLMYLKADILRKTGMYKEAITQLTVLLEFRPEYPLAAQARALLWRIIDERVKHYDESEDKEGLLEFRKQLVDISPNLPAYRYEFAGQLFKMAKFSESMIQLSYIEFDTNWGEKATALKQKAEQQLNLLNSYQLAVPLIRYGKHYLVEVTVNNISKVQLMIDTGASMTLLKPEAATASGLYVSEKTRNFNTAGGVVKGRLIEGVNLGIANEIVDSMAIAQLDLINHRGDGLLGMDFLSHFHFFLDEDNRQMLLQRKN